jgi:drug/metabolite transporter (DMT)-like permease
MLATLGVLAVVYGGSTIDEEGAASTSLTSMIFRPSAPLAGDILTLIASVGYGLYQVLYKKYAALPNDPELAPEHDLYSSLPSEDDPSSFSARTDDAMQPPPFGLHPNLLTSLIGLCTFVLLWIPLPFLHWTGIEPFAFPKDGKTVFTIAGIAFSGVLYNAGFMVGCNSSFEASFAEAAPDSYRRLGTHNRFRRKLADDCAGVPVGHITRRCSGDCDNLECFRIRCHCCSFRGASI